MAGGIVAASEGYNDSANGSDPRAASGMLSFDGNIQRKSYGGVPSLSSKHNIVALN